MMSYVLAYPTPVSAATSLVAGTITSVRLDGNGTAPLVPYVTSASYSIADSSVETRSDPWILSVNYVTQLPNSSCNMDMFNDHSYGGHDALTDNAVVVNRTKYKLSDDAKII